MCNAAGLALVLEIMNSTYFLQLPLQSETSNTYFFPIHLINTSYKLMVMLAQLFY